MDTYAVAAVGVFVVIVAIVLYFTIGRHGGKGATKSEASIELPGGLKGSIKSSNEVTPGIRADGAISRSGGIDATDNSGRGVDVKNLDAKQDITLSNNPPAPPDSKE